MKHLLTLAGFVAAVSARCDHGTTFRPRSVDTSKQIPIANYSFSGTDGPVVWHTLEDDNGLCAHGRTQSPINIRSKKTTTASGKSMTFSVENYPKGAPLLNLGSTLEVPAKGKLTRNGKTFSLAQFHFHTPSEHHIDDVYYPAEVHFVFQAKDESLAVVGFLIEVGTDKEASPLLKNVFANVSTASTPGQSGVTAPLDFSKLEAHFQGSQVFQYGGSLTTPPCLEGIAWNVVKDPIYMDVATFRASKAIMGFNSRFIQNSGGKRNLLEIGAAGLVYFVPDPTPAEVPIELVL